MTRWLFMHDRNTRPARALARVLAAVMLMAAVSVQARTPQEIFKIAAPSIVVVEVLDAGGKPEGSGSGVVIAPGEVITNCHVAAVAHGDDSHRLGVIEGRLVRALGAQCVVLLDVAICGILQLSNYGGPHGRSCSYQG